MSPPQHKFGESPYPGRRRYEGADRSRLRPEYKAAYQACLKAFWDHVKEKGWDKKMVLYISDEPTVAEGRIYPTTRPEIIAQMKTLCDMIHEVDPDIPVYSSTWCHVPEWDGYLNVWGIGYYGIVPAEVIAQRRAAGDRIWFTTDAHICLDTPYCAFQRLLPFFCFKYGADAYEFWGATWLTVNPFRFGWHADDSPRNRPGTTYFCRCPNGDGYILYPGGLIGHDGPVTSVRFEQAREGVEDYEYLYLLRALIDEAKAEGRNTAAAERALDDARQLVDIPFPITRYSTESLPDPKRLYDVRKAVAEAVEALKAAQR